MYSTLEFSNQAPIQYGEAETLSVFIRAEFDYNKYLYLTLAARK
jgi:hypothetical protein